MSDDDYMAKWGLLRDDYEAKCKPLWDDRNATLRRVQHE